MRIFCVVPRGLEPIACLDADEMLSVKAEHGDGWVAFDVDDVKDAFLFAYRAQSVSKVMISAAEIPVLPGVSVELESSFHRIVSEANWKSLLPSGLTFAVRATKLGEEDMPSPDIAALVGGIVKDKTNSVVNLKIPDVYLNAFIGSDRLALGIDLSGDELGKRPYRIFLQGQAIKAPLAYAVVRNSGWSTGSSLLDPFCQAGTVSIEAALFASGISPNKFAKERLFFTRSKLFKDQDVQSLLEGFDKDVRSDPLSITAMDESFRSISSSRKNAKLAGVEKLITFSKLDVEWLDVKFGKQGLDCVASFPIMANRTNPQSRLDGVYKEFLHQCDYTINKKGKVSILAKNIAPWLKPMKDNGFKVADSRPVWQGKEQMMLIVMVKE